ncbi:MAG: hypothetical protein ACLGH6_01985 [Gammaproteobacteria bacterium]
MTESADLRKEFNDRFNQFETRIQPFIERSTIALEKIAATEKAVSEHAIRTDAGFARIHERLDDHQADDAEQHRSIRDRIAEVEKQVAVEKPQNSRIREWVDRAALAVIALVGAAVAHGLGWL